MVCKLFRCMLGNFSSADFFKINFLKKFFQERLHRSRGGTGGLDPLKNHKNIRFLCNNGPDPLKNHKATKPVFNVGQSSARKRNAILMAFCWLADDGPLIVVFGSSLPSSNKNVKVGPPLIKFSESAHGTLPECQMVWIQIRAPNCLPRLQLTCTSRWQKSLLTDVQAGLRFCFFYRYDASFILLIRLHMHINIWHKQIFCAVT